ERFEPEVLILGDEGQFELIAGAVPKNVDCPSAVNGGVDPPEAINGVHHTALRRRKGTQIPCGTKQPFGACHLSLPPLIPCVNVVHDLCHAGTVNGQLRSVEGG